MLACCSQGYRCRLLTEFFMSIFIINVMVILWLCLLKIFLMIVNCFDSIDLGGMSSQLKKCIIRFSE